MSQRNLVERLELADLGCPVHPWADLGPRTWYGVGGPAEVLAHPASVAQLSELAGRCHAQGVPLRVLGGGANLLVASQGVPGVVVLLDDPAWRRIDLDRDTGRAIVGPGVDLFRLTPDLAKAGLDGLAQLAGIPGTVGGAVRMNAGGAYGDIGSAVARVAVLSDAGQSYARDRDDLDFGYRRSNILAPVILETEFELEPTDPALVMRRVKEIWLHKKNSQPMSDRSAGCCFKNPDPELQPAAQGRPAGMLIDRAGLKGLRIGAAHVSGVHANFISLDKGAASVDDVLAVMDRVEAQVLEKFGVRLEREIVVWPGPGESPQGAPAPSAEASA
ncbi:MAG: UDP-N-acetylmuramate dehydrogenase [Planctomycetota bacterium]